MTPLDSKPAPASAPVDLDGIANGRSVTIAYEADHGVQ